jgi:hypothetical protein
MERLLAVAMSLVSLVAASFLVGFLLSMSWWFFLVGWDLFDW